MEEWFDTWVMGHRATEPQRIDLRDDLNKLSYAIIGACIEVHRHLGPGFLESVYEFALSKELLLRGHRVERQVRIPIDYKGEIICEHVLDLVVDDQVVLELKSAESLHPVHAAQLHSYLKAGAFELGLLINFNVSVLKDGVRRIILKSAETET